MNDLTEKEQRNVRTALLFLRFRVGSWRPVAEALCFKVDTLQRIAVGKTVTPGLVFRLARLVDVSIDELLGGFWLSPRTCPHCGHPPEDFTDEETIVEDKPREAVLKLVK